MPPASCRTIMSHYEKAWQAVATRVADAARTSGRDPQSVHILAVSKTFPADAVRAVHACGQRAFGENYVQRGRGEARGARRPRRHRMAADRPAAVEQGRARRTHVRRRRIGRPAATSRAGCRPRAPTPARRARSTCWSRSTSAARRRSAACASTTRCRWRATVDAAAGAGAARLHGHRRGRRSTSARAAAQFRALQDVLRRRDRARACAWTRCRWA